MGDQRRVTEATAEVGDAVGQDVGPGLPGHHRRRGYDPLVGVEGAAVDVGVEPRVELDAAEGHAAVAQVVDRGDDRARRVVARLGAVPVGGAVVGPVRRPGGEGVGPTARAARCRPARAAAGPTASRQVRGPSPARTNSSVAKPAWAASRSPCQPQRTVPPFRPMACSWKLSSGATSSVRPSGAARSSGQPVGGRWGRRKKPSRSAPAWLGSPNSQCWKARARVPSATPPVDPLAGGEDGPADRRLVEGAGGEARQVGRGLDPEHQHRGVGVGPHRAAHGAVGHDDGLGGTRGRRPTGPDRGRDPTPRRWPDRGRTSRAHPSRCEPSRRRRPRRPARSRPRGAWSDLCSATADGGLGPGHLAAAVDHQAGPGDEGGAG